MNEVCNVLTVFKPVYYAQIFNGAAKANLNNNEITELNVYQRIYSLIHLMFCSIGYYYMIATCYNHEKYIRRNAVENILTALRMVAGFLLNANLIVVNNFFFDNNRLELFNKLLYIDGNLKIKGNNKCDAIYRFVSLSTVSVVMFHGFFLIYNIASSTTITDGVCMFMVGHLLITEYLELILMLAILFILINRIKYINNIVNVSTSVKWPNEAVNHTEMLHRMWRAYEGIASLYRIIEKNFSLFILLMVIHTFLCSLFSVQLFILSHSNELETTLSQNSLSVIFFIRIILIGVTLKRLEIQIKKTEDVCFSVIRKSANISTRRYAKNIIRVIRINMEPLTVFGMFTISCVPQKLISLTATYAIVLLHFAYL